MLRLLLHIAQEIFNGMNAPTDADSAVSLSLCLCLSRSRAAFGLGLVRCVFGAGLIHRTAGQLLERGIYSS